MNNVFQTAGRHCKNFSDQTMAAGGPWIFSPESIAATMQPLAKLGKRDRQACLAQAGGDFFLFSCAEGVNSGERISKTNPARAVHAFVADYDFDFSPDMVTEALARQKAAGLPMPHWMEVSLSGRLHVVWFFECPLIGPSEKSLWDDVMKEIGSLIGADQFYPKIDSHSYDVTQVWSASGQESWVLQDGSDSPYLLIKRTLLEGILDKCINTWEARSARATTDMTPEQALPLLQERYGDKFDWDGPFVAGSLGPSFFVEGSTSPKSAHVKNTGIMSYSDHARAAGKTFYTWEDLLGHAAVKLHKVNSLPERLNGIWTDGRAFFIEPCEGRKFWRVETPEGIQHHLQSRRGFSSRTPKEATCSPLVDALEWIKANRYVDGATSVAFAPSGVIPGPRRDGSMILNTCVGGVLPPQFSPKGSKWHWGDGGGFPTLSYYADAFLPEDVNGVSQVEYLMAWTGRFFQAAYAKKMNHGHVLVIVGPPSTGKTFFFEAILEPLFNLTARAQAYLLGESRWNEGLYRAGLWIVDDVSKGGVDPVQVASRLKQEMTQTRHVSEQKFTKAVEIDWRGRCGMGCNPDVDSMGVIPAMDDSSNTEKFLILKTWDPSHGDLGIDFSNSDELAEKIREELPRFAAWLLEYKLPDTIKANHRFGFEHYHHPDVIDTLELANQNYSLVEYLRRWASIIANDKDLKTHNRVEYDQFTLIGSIQSAWDAASMNVNMSRQLYERRFAQRLAHLIETKKLPFLHHDKSAQGRRTWTLDLEAVRMMDREDLKHAKE
jgi:hypothetical protein